MSDTAPEAPVCDCGDPVLHVCDNCGDPISHESTAMTCGRPACLAWYAFTG